MMSVKERITDRLITAFSPDSLNVIDESHQHHGHSGAREGGESHFRVQIVAQAFTGKSRLEQHRMINTALADELSGQVHALAIEARGASI
jgi:BolA family transcriptional regulator, general stress-responsive regulator